MKSCYLFFSILTLSACAFQKEESSPSTNTGYDLSVDWGIADGQSRSMLKARRTTTGGSGLPFTTDFPVTLPEIVPEFVSIAGALPTSSLPNVPSFVRLWLSWDGNLASMPVDTISVLSLSQLERRYLIRAVGIGSLLPNERSTRAEMIIEFFDASRKMTEIHIPLRTPPSKIESSEISLSEFSKTKEATGSSFRVAALHGTRLNLLRVLKFVNLEDQSVEVHLPRYTEGRLLQWTNPKNYRDTGCNGAGFAVDESPHQEVLSEQVYLLPISPQFLEEMAVTLDRPGSSIDITAVLPPGETLFVGVYAFGTRADDWMNQGPQPTELQSINVASSCYSVCTEHECECVHCSGGKTIESLIESLQSKIEPDMNVMGCFCSRRETRRNSALVSVGIERGLVTLSVPKSRTWASYRYADLNAHVDPETRSAQVLQESAEIKWMN